MALFSAVNFSEEVQAARAGAPYMRVQTLSLAYSICFQQGPTLDRASVPLYIGGSRCYTLKILP